MLDIGWTELLLIGIVALIVVGPRDLPMMFRTLGRFTGKLRAMARDFQRSMDAAADDAGVRDLARDLRSAGDAARNPGKTASTWTKNQVMGDAAGAEADSPAADSPDKAPADATGDGAAASAEGPATRALSAERAAARQRILDYSAEKARARQAAGATADGAAPDTAPAAPAEPATGTDDRG